MELLLKGKVKKLGSTFGVIKSNDYEELHFFMLTDIIEKDRLKIKLGDTVSFEMKTNKARGSDAIKIKLLTREDITIDIVENLNNKKSSQLSIDKLFKFTKPHISVKAFQNFITEGFNILETDNDDLNNLIKLIVQDNVITDIEKKFLKEKTLELNLSPNLIKKTNDYLFSNNPFFDKILEIILKDGIIKENELAFLIEKSKENSFTPSFINFRFWQYSFSLHFNSIIRLEGIKKIIKLWYLSQNSKFDLALNKDWIIVKLNILKSTKIQENIDNAVDNFEKVIFPFLEKKYNISIAEVEKIYEQMILDFDKVEHHNEILKEIEQKIIFTKNKLYSKEDIYKKLDVPNEQQKGKWNKGYCKHNNEWFIFANVDQVGYGFGEKEEFDYNNSIEVNGDMNWEATNNSNLSWDSIQNLKVSSPFVFIRKPKTQKHYWEYLGKGSCIYTLDTTPVKFKWKINNKHEITFIKQNDDVIKENNNKKLMISNESVQNKKDKFLNNTIKNSKSKSHKVDNGKIDLLTKNKFKDIYDDNPFTAFSEFKKYAYTNLKIKSINKIKMIWNKEIITND